MDVGLLWYDNDPKCTLEDKIDRAVQRYREKYGRWPNTCYVHPEAIAEPSNGAGHRVESGRASVRVVSAPNILLHHLWLGESLKSSEGQRARPN